MDKFRDNAPVQFNSTDVETEDFLAQATSAAGVEKLTTHQATF